jgi:hypothetical protein
LFETPLANKAATGQPHRSQSTIKLNEHIAERVKQESELAAKNSEVTQEEASYLLLETPAAYRGAFGAQNMPFSVDNTVFGTPLANRQRLGKAQR